VTARVPAAYDTADAAAAVDWGTISVLFSDVDETLVDDKSMRSYLDVAGPTLLGIDPQDAWQVVMRAGLTPGRRDAANLAYYALFAGLPPQALAEAGKEWFAVADGPAYWIAPTLGLCREAVRRGVAVVLVSGSHHACLDPIAGHVSATDVICTELEVSRAGLLTGRRSATAIGRAKADRARAWMTDRRIPPTAALGVGDHLSDADLLVACGQAVTVGGSSELAAELDRNGFVRTRGSTAWSAWSASRLPHARNHTSGDLP
jgi:HAD superfamily phosphoserine phosphatase-like hydrolase